MILVVMGVCGCGKTTVGMRLADRLGWAYHDADDFHSPENKAKMNRGVPLTDADRVPWLEKLQEMIRRADAAGTSAVLACSALREQFRRDLASAARELIYVHLRGSPELIAARLRDRTDHYMNPDLLESQFDALEEPDNAIEVDIDAGPDEVVDAILARLPVRIRDRASQP